MIDYPEWYTTPQVKFRMIQYTYNREVVFLKQEGSQSGKDTRMARIHNVQSLDVWIDALHLFNYGRNFGLYYSLGKYKNGIPYSTLNLKFRNFDNWNINHWKEMISYDFLLDIDAGNHHDIEFAYETAKNVKNEFDLCNVPYHLRFSGRGFHFVIPYGFFKFYDNEVFPDTTLSFNPDDNENIYKFFMDIAMRLHSLYSEMIDTKIYDSRRVTKIPYSLALYDGRNYVCVSFDNDEQFNNFNLKDMKPYAKYHEVAKLNKWKEHLFNEKGNVFKLLNELGL